ncbi:RNase P [Cedecea neteri]|uniref:RNase P n=1 Tax=Cedecea neteri TaxID=158822 RepID=A0AAN0S1U2_9ENTR|nr:RNase P [Cedecea neteri]AIR64394.1 RNase P [Cedecea neteri]
MLTQTEAFTRQTFNPIAFVGAFYVFLSDCETDAGMPQRIKAAENGDLRRASPLWLLEDECEMIGS